MRDHCRGHFISVDSGYSLTNYDLESPGLYYFNARWYDPTLGRFITEDPIKDGSNWYVYCNNNPINYIDPTGLTSELGTWMGTKPKKEEKAIEEEKIIQTASPTFTPGSSGDLPQLIIGSDSKEDNEPKEDSLDLSPTVLTISSSSNTESAFEKENKELKKLIQLVNSNIHNQLTNYNDSNSRSIPDFSAATKFKLNLIGKILLDDTFNQRNSFYNMYANYYGADGLTNPGRWSCAYLSSMFLVYSKLGYNPTIKDLVLFANSQLVQPSTNFDGNILDSNYLVGDFYDLMSNSMSRNGSDIRSLYATKENADMAIIKYRTTNGGNHFIAVNSNGYFNPDPSVKVVSVDDIYYMRWSK